MIYQEQFPFKDKQPSSVNMNNWTYVLSLAGMLITIIIVHRVHFLNKNEKQNEL